MKKYFLSGILAGVISVFAVGSAVAFLVMRSGLVPVNANQAPPPWESRLLKSALHASVARYASKETNPRPPTEENLKAGAEIYTQLCAECHGLPHKGPSIYGSSFYPPAPQLAGAASFYTEAELFWIVKHGIRNTAMPAWGSTLTDQDLWQVVALVKKFDALPPAVEAEWKGERQGAAGRDER